MTGRDYRPRSRAVRMAKSHAFAAVSWVVAGISIVVLGVLFWTIGSQGLEYLDLDFLRSPPSRFAAEAGLGPAIWGSVMICSVCGLVALPLGVGTAVFLEEYKPKGRLLRNLHGFVQLNIANLAGVPSIVYGIIGLTVFVQMFGLLGHANDPLVQIGASHYDEFMDESGAFLHVAVEDRSAPMTVPSEGMVLYDDEGEPVTVTLVDPETWTYPDPSDVPKGTLRADTEGNRIELRRPWYAQLPLGRGILAGGLTLMLVILPIVIISSQESIRAVPLSMREGALGLGATKWQTVRSMTLPAAIPGIMTGSILAMSRAIGEAAPILIIAGTVYITFTPEHLMDEFTAMPLQIYDWAGRPQKAFHEVAASGIIVLLAVLLTFNAAAVFIRQRFSKPLQ